MLYVRVKVVKISKLSIKIGENFSFRSHYWKRVIFYLLESKLVSEKAFKHDRRFIIRQTFYFLAYQWKTISYHVFIVYTFSENKK